MTFQGSQFPHPLLNLLIRFGFFLGFSLFPNGCFMPRWTSVFLGVFLAEEVIGDFLSTRPLGGPGWPNLFAELLWLATLLSLVPNQWYRYHHFFGAIERQQIKWEALGISIVTVGFVVRLVQTLLIPRLNEPGLLYYFLSTLMLLSVSLVIPLSIGLAILGYRLWDVDVLINKALVYDLLTSTLAAVYAGLVVGLESLVGQFSAHTAQPLVIILSTITIAELFQPLRRRIQRLIDRRFYRKKYDAAKTLDALSSMLRNEVNLEQLSAVVNEMLQPGHVSLWLSSPERPGENQSTVADTKDKRWENDNRLP